MLMFVLPSYLTSNENDTGMDFLRLLLYFLDFSSFIFSIIIIWISLDKTQMPMQNYYIYS